jgi:homocysteine S-methyltransferase
MQTSPRTAFVERLKTGPLLWDGAMGTQLYERSGLNADRCLEELNVSNPELVKAIHLDYIRAGAQVIETNTFGANALRLAPYGLAEQVVQINRAGVELAREAQTLTGQSVWIAGAIGPLGQGLAPLGPIGLAQARSIFADQARALSEAGVDLITLETFTDLREVQEAISACREVCDLPIVAHITFVGDGPGAEEDGPEEAVRTLADLDVEAIGLNCSVGSERMLQAVEAVSAITYVPISAQPNAGFPTYQGGRLMYLSSPEYVAQYARRMVEAGATLVGGCCGTSPQHIAAIRDALVGVQRPGARMPAEPAPKRTRIHAAPKRVAEPTGLSKKLGSRFVVTVEVDPPKGFDVAPVLEALTPLRESGLVDAINVADSPRAQSRMSALAMASIIQSRLGMETIMHVALRHRNLVALHSDLMGAHALGLRNVFAVMGDLPSTGDFPDATSVSDITASGSIRMIKALNSGVDLTGRPIEQSTAFNVGCAFGIGSADLDRESRILEKKIDAGADFILTQPVFSAEAVEVARHRLGGFPVPLLLGVLPLRSHRHAEFLHNEVPGISVPDEIRERLRSAGDKAAEVGIQLARDLLDEVSGIVDGVYLMPQFGRYDAVLDVLAGAKVMADRSPGGEAMAQ